MLKLSCTMLAAVVLTACGSAGGDALPTSSAKPDTLVSYFGNAQEWFANAELPQPVVAAISNGAGEPLSGVSVRFSNANGIDTTITTGPQGNAVMRWKLSATPGVQRLDVKVGSRSPVSGAVFAQAVARDSADVIIVHGVTGNEFTLLDFDRTNRRAIRIAFPDTVVSFLPRNGLGIAEEVVALTAGHPPISVPAPWSPRPDTVHIRFKPPVALPMSLWFLNDSSFSASKSRNDIGALDAAFGATMMGVRVGTVTVHNVSSLDIVSPNCAANVPGEDAGQVNVYYLKTPFGGQPSVAGMTCDRRRILLVPASVRVVTFPHEMGHSFGWPHVLDTKNLMYADPPLAQLTLGQILRAHFWTSSSLNELYKLNPVGVRSCAEPNLRCMELEWDGL